MKHRILALATALTATGALCLCAFAQTEGDKAQASSEQSAQEAAASDKPAAEQKNHRWHKRKHKQQSAQVSSDLPWHDVTSGFELAKKSKKPMLTDFYTDWCGWCKVMDAKTYTDPAVKKLMEDNFVLVKANAEDNASGEKLAKELRIDAYPLIVLFDQNGKPKANIVGFKKADDFSSLLNLFLAGKPLPSDD